MKRTWKMIAVVISLVVFLGSYYSHARAQDFFYYHKGEPVRLNLSKKFIAFRTSVPQRVVDSYVEMSSQRVQLPGNLNLVKLQYETVDKLSAKLESDSNVSMIAKVFDSNGALMIVGDEFIIKLRPNVKLEELGITSDQIVKKMNGTDEYVVRASSGDALTEANFHSTENHHSVEYAQPNFIRVLEPLSSVHNFQTKTFGEEGSGGYRKIEYSMIKSPVNLSDNNLTAVDDENQTTVTNVTIFSDNFQNGFPSDKWNLKGSPTWGLSDARPFNGHSTVYCVGSANPPLPYVESWAVYGPFSLADAELARVDLTAWVKTDQSSVFWVAASTDGQMFSGMGLYGNFASSSGPDGWMNISLDLNDIFSFGNLCGRDKVWIALIFHTNAEMLQEGVYIGYFKVQKIIDGMKDISNDPLSRLQWALSNNGQSFGNPAVDAGIVKAWDISQGSDNITIAFIDEGVNLKHEDLEGKFVPGYDAMGLGSQGQAFSTDDHGSLCAGTAASRLDNGIGIAGISKAKIMPVRIAYESAFGWITTDFIIADGINWAVAHGADILSNSWGGGLPSPSISNAITNAKINGRKGKGCFVAFAAGNDNSYGTVYPAADLDTFAVGAISPCDELKTPMSCEGEFWWGTNRGSDFRKLDVVAPGVRIAATDFSNYILTFNGTSAATAIVSGVVSLVLSACPDLQVAQLESIVRDTAVSLRSQPEFTRIDAEAASSAAIKQCGGLQIYVSGQDNYLWQTVIREGQSSGWHRTKFGLTDQASAEIYYNGAIQLFSKNLDGTIEQEFLNAASLESNLGGYSLSAPSAIIHDGKLYLFAVGADHALWYKFSDNWSAWQSLGGYIIGTPSAVVFGGNLLVYGTGYDHAIWNKAWDGNWSSWSKIGGWSNYGPSAVVYNGQLYLFAIGWDHALWSTSWDSFVWKANWAPIGGYSTSSPAAVVYNDTLYVLMAGADHAVWWNAFNGIGWLNFKSIGGVTFMAPSAIDLSK